MLNELNCQHFCHSNLKHTHCDIGQQRMNNFEYYIIIHIWKIIHSCKK